MRFRLSQSPPPSTHRRPTPPPLPSSSPAERPEDTAAGAAKRRARFETLAARYEADLLRLGRRVARGNEDRAQDLVQDTLIRAYESFLSGGFREGTNARAWMMRILMNAFLNEERRKKWDAGVDVDTLTAGGEIGPASTRAAPADVPDQAILENMLNEPLEKALDALPEALRLTVLLVDVEGLEYVEAAQTLNVPVGTVRSRLNRARLQLFEMLKDVAREQHWLGDREINDQKGESGNQ